MEIKIIEIYEQGNQLRVKVETPYGIQNIGMGLHMKYLDPETDQPKWKKEVRKLLEMKYGPIENRVKTELKEAKELVGKKIKLNDLAPIDSEVELEQKKMKNE